MAKRTEPSMVATIGVGLLSGLLFFGGLMAAGWIMRDMGMMSELPRPDVFVAAVAVIAGWCYHEGIYVLSVYGACLGGGVVYALLQPVLAGL